MQIKTAEFVTSCPSLGSCPESTMPEYAFIGRSNVGKSSLINMLAGKKSLALTSSKPGKTLLINYFLINGKWHLVDLPGYGFASIGKSAREKLHKMIVDYTTGRMQLTNLFVLVDSRLEPQKIDLDFISFLGRNSVPFSIVFTKADKVSRNRLKTAINDYSAVLSEQWETLPPMFSTSAETRMGREELLSYIESINHSIEEEQNK